MARLVPAALSGADIHMIYPPTVMHYLTACKSYIESLVARGGPLESDDAVFLELLAGLRGFLRDAEPPFSEVDFREWFGPAMSDATLQGRAVRHPRGYDDDFEIIDRIYRRDVSADKALTNWDRFYQRQTAPEAVRNRKAYFHALLDRHAEPGRPLQVLKLANGPGRCLFEWFELHPDAPVQVDCVEGDAAAIAHSVELNRPYLDRVSFTHAEARSYRPHKAYDLIWVPGLFDSFNNGLAVAMIIRLMPSLAPGGQLVIGNFSDRNPSRNYMELLGECPLYQRSDEQWRELALACGVAPECIRVGGSPGSGHLFLHLAAEAERLALMPG